MSEIPEHVNSPRLIKLRTAAAMVRLAQELSPYLDDVRLITQEITDVVAAHGGTALTDTELAELNISAATVTQLATFYNALTAFMDATAAPRPQGYRGVVNSVKRVAAQI